MLRAYMVGSKTAGFSEGASLVIAHTSKEARKIGYKILRDWYSDQEWTDVSAKWLKSPNKQARELLQKGDPAWVECPDSCSECEKWGYELDDNNVCELCNKRSRDQRLK